MKREEALRDLEERLKRINKLREQMKVHSRRFDKAYEEAKLFFR